MEFESKKEFTEFIHEDQFELYSYLDNLFNQYRESTVKKNPIISKRFCFLDDLFKDINLL